MTDNDGDRESATVEQLLDAMIQASVDRIDADPSGANQTTRICTLSHRAVCLI
jgi:hypothetical protein